MKQNFTVRQGALDGVEAFLSVAQHRSFRKAAAELAVTPSAISQAVRTLEARVGAALFIRTTRSVGLTEAGERFLSRAKPAFEELIAASEVARDLGQRPSGLLRISVPRAVVPLILEPIITSFCEEYPEIELEIAASDEMVDLAAGGFDAGIRLGQFIEPDMTAVRLTRPFPLVVVGSPDYLRGRKRPERIDDLRGHACLRMRRSTGSIAPWPFVDGNKGPRRDRPVRAAHAQAGMAAQIVDAFRPLPSSEIVRATDHHQGERRRQPHRRHVGLDELAQTNACIEPAGRKIDHLVARGDLQLYLGVGLAERGDRSEEH